MAALPDVLQSNNFALVARTWQCVSSSSPCLAFFRESMHDHWPSQDPEVFRELIFILSPAALCTPLQPPSQ